MSNITTEEFNQALVQILSEQSAEDLLQIPGLYEVVSEHFNNEVLEKAAEAKEEEAYAFHSVPPTSDGRHPEHPHLVYYEIEPHYGSYILTSNAKEGDALIGEDDARGIFGAMFDDEFCYASDEYLELLD